MEFKREKEMKKILENRKIQPSAHLWDKLENELDQPVKKNHFYYYLSALAAILVVVLLIGGKLWFNSSEVLPGHQVSGVEVIPNEDKVNESLVSEEIDVSEPAQINVQPSREKKSKINVEVNHLPHQGLASGENKTKNMSSPKNSSEEKNKKPQEYFLANTETQETKNEENLFEDMIKHVEKELSLEQEAEELLAEVMRENSEIPENEINANDLLAEIEAELPDESERNLKEQMHQILKEGWDKAKIALAINK